MHFCALLLIVACRVADSETGATRHVPIPIPEGLGHRVTVGDGGEGLAFVLIEVKGLKTHAKICLVVHREEGLPAPLRPPRHRQLQRDHRPPLHRHLTAHLPPRIRLRRVNLYPPL